MANITLRRRPSRKQRVMKAMDRSATAARKLMKARLAWAAGRRLPKAATKAVKGRVAWVTGKKAAKVAVPAVAVGTAAVVAKRSGRFDRSHDGPASSSEQPAGTAPTAVA